MNQPSRHDAVLLKPERGENCFRRDIFALKGARRYIQPGAFGLAVDSVVDAFQVVLEETEIERLFINDADDRVTAGGSGEVYLGPQKHAIPHRRPFILAGNPRCLGMCINGEYKQGTTQCQSDCAP